MILHSIWPKRLFSSNNCPSEGCPNHKRAESNPLNLIRGMLAMVAMRGRREGRKLMIDPKIAAEVGLHGHSSSQLLYAQAGKIAHDHRLVVAILVSSIFIVVAGAGLLDLVKVNAPSGGGTAPNALLILFLLTGVVFLFLSYKVASISMPITVALWEDKFEMASLSKKQHVVLELDQVKSVQITGQIPSPFSTTVNCPKIYVETTRWHRTAREISPFKNRRVGPFHVPHPFQFSKLIADRSNCPIKYI